MKKSFRRMLTILIAVVLVVGAAVCGIIYGDNLKAEAATYSGDCGYDATWTYSNGVLTIRKKYGGGTGSMSNYTKPASSNQAPWISSSDKIKTIVIEEGITSIGSYAFWGCYYATKVTIPSTVTSIV